MKRFEQRLRSPSVQSKRRVLVFADYYLPGFKAGGPIRSLANIVESLGDDFAFRVVTRDRDAGDSTPYPGIEQNRWQSVGKAEVLHLSPDQLRASTLRQVIAEGSNQVAYLNSFFSPAFTFKTVTLRRSGLVPRIPLIVAPRGEFSPSAFKLKRTKKLAYLAFAKAARLYEDVLWQASNHNEENDIRRWFGAVARIVNVPDVNTPGRTGVIFREPKRPGHIKIVFASRISRIKNLDAGLQMISKVSGRVELNVYGPIEDPAYWNACANTIAGLPENVLVNYHGAIDHEKVAQVLSENHLFFLPTLSESYGHAIVEAMLAGCPVLISDQTPWRNLESYQAGWDIPLQRVDLFQRALQTCIDMDEATYQPWSNGTRAYAAKRVDANRSTELTRTLFEEGLKKSLEA